jgi:hypothetical protein
MASEAEERIRLKCEALLRKAFPDARIVHELVLRQGGVRIDLAAVTPDRLVCVEVKSERDVLDRLPAQIAAMKLVCDAWRVATADKHLDKCRDIADWHRVIGETSLDAPGYGMRELPRDAMHGLCNAPARLDMLWANELRYIAGAKGPRMSSMIRASDSMTGAQIRRAVCAAIRARSFPRADPAIPFLALEQAV